jgi:serine/threonine protein kinase
VLDALRSLHGLDVVHRDLKPENVFRVRGRWKLGDFGIAKNVTRLVTQMTFKQAGTLGYAPPEQFDGAEATASADVYAFGKLLTFLVTGDTDPDKVAYPSWARLIRACTRADPEQRPELDEVETLLTALQV